MSRRPGASEKQGVAAGFPGFLRWLIVPIFDKLAAVLICLAGALVLAFFTSVGLRALGSGDEAAIVWSLLTGLVAFAVLWVIVLYRTYVAERRSAHEGSAG